MSPKVSLSPKKAQQCCDNKMVDCIPGSNQRLEKLDYLVCDVTIVWPLFGEKP